ncbi:hypothetical protein M758_UG120300 [Ceratodon purpureus]|nr:hypothetical protein M758_UG120300 [Ceratodon purpureus]
MSSSLTCLLTFQSSGDPSSVISSFSPTSFGGHDPPEARILSFNSSGVSKRPPPALFSGKRSPVHCKAQLLCNQAVSKSKTKSPCLPDRSLVCNLEQLPDPVLHPRAFFPPRLRIQVLPSRFWPPPTRVHRLVGDYVGEGVLVTSRCARDISVVIEPLLNKEPLW